MLEEPECVVERALRARSRAVPIFGRAPSEKSLYLPTLRLSAEDQSERLTALSYSVILNAMKVAVSVPDRVFEEAELVVKRLRVSRSRVYSQALAEFVKKHREEGVRESLDAVYRRAPSRLDPVLTDLQADALREEW